MTTSYTSEKLRFKTAERFKEGFSSTDNPFVSYIIISNHIPYDDELSPDFIYDTVSEEKNIWDNMIGGKRVNGNNVELVIPNIEYSHNVHYRQYDDMIDLEMLATSEPSQNLYPMYIINTEGNVYKCLSNNNGSISTIEPLGKNLTSNGNIITTDNYIWKYMYNILDTNKFLSNNWIPCPTISNLGSYASYPETKVDGELITINIDDGGSGYINSDIIVSQYNVGCTTLTIVDTTDIQNTIKPNMSVSGTGIVGDVFIKDVNVVNRKINLAYATISSGGGFDDPVSVKTRVIVRGDGIGAYATANVVNGSIDKINVTNIGVDYNYANVVIYGTANNAIARAILPPRYGHGYNPARELNAINVMVQTKLGEIDSTENGLISANTSFRQYALLMNPYKYMDNAPIAASSANSVFSQVTVVSLIPGPLFDDSEFVYQGNIENPTFSGRVNTQTINDINLTNVKGKISIGLVLKGVTTNLNGRTVFDIKYPEFKPYTGDILYAENFKAVQREIGQAENIKFIIQF